MLLRHLRALWRAETLIGEIKLNALLKRSGLAAMAGLLGVFGFAMLNAAGYLALAPEIGGPEAMLVVALVDFALAGAFLFLAKRVTTPQIEVAEELRDQAVHALEVDARLAVEEVRGFVLRPVRMASSASAVAISLLTAFLRARRRR